MASLSTDSGGNRTVQFVGTDGKRRSIRLGKVSKKVAESVKLKVEALNAAAIARLPLDGETAAWVAGIGDDLAAKLAAVGLIPDRRSEALGPFLADYLSRRRNNSKGGTVTSLTTVANDLTRFLGEQRPIRDVAERQAEDFKAHLQARELAPATVARRLKAARMFFKHALRIKLVASNPFADVAAPGGVNELRKQYVSAADTAKLIGAANPGWRVIVALCRFAGLRCPSEVLTLKWTDVNFETGRMTVNSPKTEHLPGKAYRVVPIFAELRPYLDEAFELAEPGAVYVVGGTQGDGYRAAAQGPRGWNGANLRTTFLKLIRRAGLQPWPRLFHNLRASCETDLMQSFPIHVVCSWLGNTPRIALDHYLQTLDRDFEKAIGGAKSGAVVVQIPVQTAAAGNGHQTPDRTEPLAGIRVSPLPAPPDFFCPIDPLTRRGLEPLFPP